MFTISGALVAEQAGRSAIVVVLTGTTTGVAGGVVRDVLTAEVLLILSRPARDALSPGLLSAFVK